MEKYLIELTEEKNRLFREIEEAKKVLKKINTEDSLIEKIDNNLNYINNLAEMILNNKEDEIKLNSALLLFLEEYEGKAKEITEIIDSEFERIKYLNK